MQSHSPLRSLSPSALSNPPRLMPACPHPLTPHPIRLLGDCRVFHTGSHGACEATRQAALPLAQPHAAALQPLPQNLAQKPTTLAKRINDGNSLSYSRSVSFLQSSRVQDGTNGGLNVQCITLEPQGEHDGGGGVCGRFHSTSLYLTRQKLRVYVAEFKERRLDEPL